MAEKKEEQKKKKTVTIRKLYKVGPLDEATRPKLAKYVQPDVVTRRQWWARYSSGSGSVAPLEFPLDQVIISHTESDPCGDQEACTCAIRGMQTFFMRLGYHDIPYNFIITHEGVIFEGRAWIDECPLPEGLGKQSKTLVIGVIGKTTDCVGPTRDTVYAKIKEITDHGEKYQLIEPRFLRREMDSWHFRVLHAQKNILEEKIGGIKQIEPPK